MESGNDCDTMAGSMKSFHELLAKFDIPLEKAKDVNINEYAVYGEQVPSAGAWWIAGLERENAHGLRGNWAIAGALHDFLAGKYFQPCGIQDTNMCKAFSVNPTLPTKITPSTAMDTGQQPNTRYTNTTAAK